MVLGVAFILVIIATSVSDKSLWDQDANRRIDAWWTMFDRVGTFTTLAVAIAVWWGEIRQEWELQLPTRLFVYFLLDRREKSDHPPKEELVAACLGANLSNESDSRALGQQIGAQLLDTKFFGQDAARIDIQRLALVVTPQGSFRPVRVVFRLTDASDVDRLGLPADPKQALFWLPRHPDPNKANPKHKGNDGKLTNLYDLSSPLCQVLSPELNDETVRISL